MGLTITCDFCGKPDETYHRLLIYNMDEPDLKSDCCACQECLEKYILSNMKQEKIQSLIQKSKKQSIETAFNGMILRDFLRTEYYLDDINTVYIFKTQLGDTIIDLRPWMGQPILQLSRKNENSEIFVTLADNTTTIDD